MSRRCSVATPLVKRSRSGFTLVELMVSMVLLSLIFIGVVTLFLGASATAMRSNAQVDAANSAGRAMERVMGDTREAYSFALPDDATGFTPPLSYSASQFETTFNSATIDTGIEIMSIPTGSVSVLNSAGTSVALSPAPYSGTGTNILWVYRSNIDGTPNASAGQYLWAYGTEQGRSVNNAIVHLCDTPTNAAALVNAVQIVRPMNSATPPAAVPYQVEYTLISSYYGYVKGSQVSETSGTTMLTGRVALVRNHP